MIFVTVGAQMPFDRLVQTVDEWAGRRRRGDILAQIGPTSYAPRHMRAIPFLSPEEFRATVESASTVVSHAGMGCIITALELRKPILVMPRRARLRETRNDHQVATAQRLSLLGYVSVAADESELLQRLDDLDDLPTYEIRPWASPELIGSIRRFIDGTGNPPR